MLLKAFTNIFKQKNSIANVIDDNLIEKVRIYVLSTLSPQRYEHSQRTAQMAVRLSERYGEDKNACFLAAISHDMCKEWDRKDLQRIAIESDEVVTMTELKKPSLLHGKVAAVILRNKFFIKNEDILEAVACHTFGRKNMCNIAKICCIADKIELGRPYMSSSRLKNLLELSLDDLLKTVLTEIIDLRKKKKDEVFPEALWVIDKTFSTYRD